MNETRYTEAELRILAEHSHEIVARNMAAEALRLLAERGVSFEMVVDAITRDDVLVEIDNPSPRYRGQRLLIVKMAGYIYLGPFRESDQTVFLITIIPSRKAKRRYIEGGGLE